MLGRLGLNNISIGRKTFHTHHVFKSLKLTKHENLKKYKILESQDHKNHKP